MESDQRMELATRSKTKRKPSCYILGVVVNYHLVDCVLAWIGRGFGAVCVSSLGLVAELAFRLAHFL